MSKKKLEMVLPSLVETQNPVGSLPGGISANIKVEMVSLSAISDYHKHTFDVAHDESMDDLIASFRSAEAGISPILVRKSEHGTPYECISGHRRRYAAKEAGYSEIAAIIIDVDDDRADVLMVDCNNHRPKLSLREQCFSLKVKYDALKRQGKSAEGTRSDEQLAAEQGMSRTSVQNKLTLTKLIPELFDLISEGIYTQQVGRSLSVMKKEGQKVLFSYLAGMRDESETEKMPKITPGSADEIAALTNVTQEALEIILGTHEKKKKPSFKMTEKDIEGCFPQDFTEEISERKQLIRSLLKEYFGMGMTGDPVDSDSDGDEDV